MTQICDFQTTTSTSSNLSFRALVPLNMPRELTEEQIAIQAQRKQKKLEALKASGSTSTSGTSTPVASFDLASNKGKILLRDWAQIEPPPVDNERTLKIMTWNMLAQTLVRT